MQFCAILLFDFSLYLLHKAIFIYVSVLLCGLTNFDAENLILLYLGFSILNWRAKGVVMGRIYAFLLARYNLYPFMS